MRIFNQLFYALPIAVAAACGGPADTAHRINASQVVLNEPPDAIGSGSVDGTWHWSFDPDDDAVTIRHYENAEPRYELTPPGTQIAWAGIRDVSGDTYLLVGTLDATEKFALYRYEDADADGGPDDSTETLLFDTGLRETYVTSLAFDAAGNVALLDARCQDIVVAEDTDSDGWPNSFLTTPLAKSDDYPDLLNVRSLAYVDGKLEAYPWGTPTRNATWNMKEVFEYHEVIDANGDFVAENVVTISPARVALEIRGLPYDGQTELDVRGAENETIQVWSLDGDLDPVSQLGSATAGTGWTTVSLSSSLTEGDHVGVRYGNEAGTLLARAVWKAWPQVTGAEERLITFEAGVGGTATLRGHNFASTMTLKMKSADGTEYDLDFTVQDATTVTATIPSLGAAEQGTCVFWACGSGQPAGDGYWPFACVVCDEDAVVAGN